jgi:hypothetical protein
MNREEVIIRYGADTSGVERGLRSMRSKMTEFSGGVADTFKGLSGIVAGVFTSAGIIRMAEDLNRLKGAAEGVGVTARFLDGFGQSLDDLGVSEEVATKSLELLNRKMGEAREGVAASEAAFRKYGLSLFDAAGNGMKTEAMLAAIAGKMSALEDPQLRAAMAADLFGDKMGAKLIPLLSQGTKAVEDFVNASKLTDQSIAAVAELRKQLDDAGDAATGWAAHTVAAIAKVAQALGSLTAGGGGSGRVGGQSAWERGGGWTSMFNLARGGLPGFLGRAMGHASVDADVATMNPNRVDPNAGVEAARIQLERTRQRYEDSTKTNAQRLQAKRDEIFQEGLAFSRSGVPAGSEAALAHEESILRKRMELAELQTRADEDRKRAEREVLDAEKKISDERKHAAEEDRRAAQRRIEDLQSLFNAAKGASANLSQARAERNGLTIEQLAEMPTNARDPYNYQKRQAWGVMDARDDAQAALERGDIAGYQSFTQESDFLTKQLGLSGLLKPSELGGIEEATKAAAEAWAKYLDLVTTEGIKTNPANGP